MTTTSPRPAVQAAPPAVRLRPADLAALASIGLRTRKLRAGLSALGIAIGVAAIVAVLGLAASSAAGLTPRSGAGHQPADRHQRARLHRQHRRAAGGGAGHDRAAARRHRRPGHRHGQRRQRLQARYIPPIETNALTVAAASLGLPAVVGTSVAQGSYLNAATAREPVAVLGAEAAQLMGIDRIRPGERIWVGPLASGST